MKYTVIRQNMTRLLSPTEHISAISRTSKIELAESLAEAKNSLSKLSAFLTIVLFSIGILNFINTMSANILNRKKEFHMGYLSGFQAEKRDMEREEFALEVEREREEYGTTLLRDTISGYGSVAENSHSNRILSEQWSYVLLPVWTLTYKGKNNKMFYYTMNGQNGEVYGELPVDAGRVGLAGALVGLAVLILFLIGGYLI